MKQDIRRILIVRTDRIGDVILTLPMAQVLKQHFPAIQVSMLIRRYTRELVEGNPWVDEVLFYDEDDRPLPFRMMVRILRQRNFDAAVLTYPRFRLALLLMLAGIRTRIGTGYRWYSFLITDRVFEHRKDARRHELEYNLNLLRELDPALARATAVPELPVRDDDRFEMRERLRRAKVAEGDLLVIVHPGSGGSARDWPAQNFEELVRRLMRVPNVAVIVTGSAAERPLVERVVAGTPGVVTMAGELTLRQFGALSSLAKVFISNSTGPIHIAAAVGTFVVGLYPQVTPLSPARWSPVTSKKIVLSPAGKPPDCRKCESGASTPCECMESISVDRVFEEVQKQLAETSGTPLS